MKKILALALAAVAGIGLFSVGAAPADDTLHLKLDASMPEADQTLAASPDKIALEFSERPELAVSRITIENAKLGKVARSEDDETILWVAIEEPLSAGAHTVRWMTASSDGHAIDGEFSFTVGAGR